jgi:hypothetical protein
MGFITVSKTNKVARMHLAESLPWLCRQGTVAVINLDQFARAIHVTP